MSPTFIINLINRPGSIEPQVNSKSINIKMAYFTLGDFLHMRLIRSGLPNRTASYIAPQVKAHWVACSLEMAG
jgi:hypothetical protein